MPFNNEDIAELERILDDRYVRRKDCTLAQKDQQTKLDELKTDVTKIGTKLNLITGILATIGGAFLALAIKFIFGG